MMAGVYTIILLIVSIALLLLLISYFKVHPFISLLVVSVMTGLAAGLTPASTMQSITEGFGSTLGSIGIIIVLGTIIGEILAKSGGAISISDTIINTVGEKRINLAMSLTGYIVSISTFSDVGYIILHPIAESVSARAKKPLISVILSLTVGLFVTHALVPPTPGPIAAAGILHADLGLVAVVGMFVALCGMATGLFFVSYICKKYPLEYEKRLEMRMEENTPSTPPAFVACSPILVPLVLISLRSFSDAGLFGKGPWNWFLSLLGDPVIALFLGLLLALPLLRRSDNLRALGKTIDISMQKAAGVILITGAGGAFGNVVRTTGIGETVAGQISMLGIPAIILPFVLSSVIVTATGSITVALVTASSIIAPMMEVLGLPPVLTVAMIGAGSFCVIHANSSFFWLLNQMDGIEPSVLYRTYVPASLFMGLGSFAGVMFLWLLGVRI